MRKEEVVSGIQRAWTLKEKLGEGDAGEVFRVESLIERKSAIIKRPIRSVFTSDFVRQAAQIDREARILRALAQHKFPTIPISTPKWLDQSPAGSEFSERFFIIITEAKGINLAALARSARFGAIRPDEKHLLAPTGLSAFEETYVNTLVSANRIPDLVILRILENLLSLLEHLHTIENQSEESSYAGIIWNDVKPDHIFYQPQSGHITIIDWGNSHFLEANGATTDRQYSRLDDYRQFLAEMGQFVEAASPGLFSALQWPGPEQESVAVGEKVFTLHERIRDQLKIAVRDLAQAHHREKEIIASQTYRYEDYISLKQIQQDLQILGEIPDFEAARNFEVRIAQELIKSGEIEKFSHLCEILSEDAAQDAHKWRLLSRISALLPTEPALRSSLHYALKEEWSSVLWELRSAARYEPTPDWWDELSSLTRGVELNGTNQPVTPRTALNRLILSLQSALQYQPVHSTNHENLSASAEDSTANLKNLADSRNLLIQSLKDEVGRHWDELEPTPPNADISYQEVLRYSQEILDLAPAAGQTLFKALEQPLAHYHITMDAWEKQEFEIARRGLRHILMWDPDRKRLLTADSAIQAAPGWIIRLRKGPAKDEALQDFVTRFELEGRELRNQVGPANWLDSNLSALRNLRKGGEPTETLVQHPTSRAYLSWLLELESQAPLLSTPGKQLQLQRKTVPEQIDSGLRGIHETGIGAGQDIEFTQPLDTWTPEASGSSARVIMATIQGRGRNKISAAIKIMRPNRIDYALPLFREEVQILSLLRDVPGVARMLEFGFMSLSNNSPLLSDEHPTRDLHGRAARYGLDSTHNFLIDLEKQTRSGLLPYLAIEAQEQKKNLLTLCDTGYTHGHFLPVLEGLVLCIQICDILEAAHQRNISYRDHKILHYYWDEATNGVIMIDWNIAKRHPTGLTSDEARFDLVQFGARAMHHILTGRTAPGALPLGPTRPDEIEAAAKSYQVQWTYDDKRLPKTIKDLMEKVLSGVYEEPRQLRADLTIAFQQLSELAQQENQTDQTNADQEDLG